MNRELIIKDAKAYISQALSGHIVENSKLDFKREWYNLKDEPQINEFLKDATAIINTVGPDGYIIIGVNEKNQTLHDVTFQDSKLKDSNELNGIISKRVDRPFDINYIEDIFEEIKIGILHFPPSLDKPHIIRNYKTFYKDGNIKKEEEQKIFVRAGTTTRTANKYDIELMLYDRKNILPEYDLIFYINHIRFLTSHGDTVKIECTLNIENLGRRPASICDFNLYIHFKHHNFKFYNPSVEIETKGHLMQFSVKSRNIIVKPQDITQHKVFLLAFPDSISASTAEILNKAYIERIEIEAFLNNGKRIIDSNIGILFK